MPHVSRFCPNAPIFIWLYLQKYVSEEVHLKCKMVGKASNLKYMVMRKYPFTLRVNCKVNFGAITISPNRLIWPRKWFSVIALNLNRKWLPWGYGSMHLVIFGMDWKSEKCSFDPCIIQHHAAFGRWEILPFPMMVSSFWGRKLCLMAETVCRVHSTGQSLPCNSSERNNWNFFVLWYVEGGSSVMNWHMVPCGLIHWKRVLDVLEYSRFLWRKSHFLGGNHDFLPCCYGDTLFETK